MYGAALTLLLYVMAATLVCLAITVTVVAAYIAYVHRKYEHLPGPPFHSFFLGHLPQLRAYRNRGEYVSRLFLKWAEENGPCFKIFVLHRCIISLNGVAQIKEILTKSRYIKAPATYARLHSICGNRFLGNGVLTQTDHEKWHQRRTILNPAFHKKYLRLSMTQFNEVGDAWVTTLDRLADGETMFRMHDYLQRITLDAIAEVAFNFKMNAMESEKNPYIMAILYVVQAISKSMRDPLLRYRPSEREFRSHVKNAIAFLREGFGKSRLAERTEAIKAGETVPEDILCYIMRCKEAIPELTDEDLLDDVLTLFIAGQETTANVLSFLFLEAGRRPDVVLKLQQEVDSVLEGRLFVEYEDLSRLEYVGQVFKETLRLYPVASGTSRHVNDEVNIDGFRIPGNSDVFCSFFVIQRLSRHYKEPEEFRPERFAKSEPRPLFTYLPFSLGHRTCAGQQFASIESKVLLCKFFQKFTFVLDPDQSFDILETAALRPLSGTRMKLARR